VEAIRVELAILAAQPRYARCLDTSLWRSVPLLGMSPKLGCIRKLCQDQAIGQREGDRLQDRAEQHCTRATRSGPSTTSVDDPEGRTKDGKAGR